MELISKLTVTGAANINIGFNPYTFYTNNNNYMKIEVAHDFTAQTTSTNGYLYKCSSMWFTFEKGKFGCYFNFANTTGVIDKDHLPNIDTTDGVTNPITIVLNNGTATATQGSDTQTNTYSGSMPNNNVTFYPSSSAIDYGGEFYGFKVYGAGDVLAHHYVGFDDGVDVGIMDLVTEQKYTPTGSNYTIACEEYVQPAVQIPINKYKLYTSNIQKTYNGSTQINKMYIGSDLVYRALPTTIMPTTPTNVDYVHTSSSSSLTANYINTGIYPTIDTVFRIVFKPNQKMGNCIVGYDFTDAPDSQKSTPTRASSDDTDYRLINYSTNNKMHLDFNNSRIEKTMSTDSGGYIDITCGNNYITDDISQSTQTGTTQSSMATQNVPIYLNVSSDLDFQSLEIWDNNTKVYDGHAAVLNGVYGVYDSVGGTFTTETYGGNSMTGGNI